MKKTWGESFAERVKSALLGITDPELLPPFPRKRFVPTNNAEYQPIEDTAKAIGLLDSP